MKKKILLLAFPAIALILEVLPYGAVMCHFNPKGRPLRETYSYFDLVPFGNANFWPLFTGILTCVLLILAILSFWKSRWLPPLGGTALLALVISLLPLLYGLPYYSLAGAGISLMLLAEWILARSGSVSENIPRDPPSRRIHEKE